MENERVAGIQAMGGCEPFRRLRDAMKSREGHPESILAVRKSRIEPHDRFEGNKRIRRPVQVQQRLSQVEVGSPIFRTKRNCPLEMSEPLLRSPQLGQR